MTWRDNLKIHPAADLFPLLKDTDPAALQALADDIKTNGLQCGIVFYGTGAKVTLLDGRNRLDAMELAGILKLDKCRHGHPVSFAHTVIAPNDGTVDHQGKFKKVDPFDYVISVNAHRRHLTAKDKADLIVKVLAAKPELSDCAAAKIVKVDHKTVAAARAKAEANGDIPHKAPSERVEASGRKARGQKPSGMQRDPPASPASPASPEAEPAHEPLMVHRGVPVDRPARLKELIVTAFRDEALFVEFVDLIYSPDGWRVIEDIAGQLRHERAELFKWDSDEALLSETAAEPVQQPEAPAATTMSPEPNIAPTEPAAAAVNALEVAAPACAKPGGCGYGGCISQGRCLWTPGGMAPP
jgi:hypothetical protein